MSSEKEAGDPVDDAVFEDTQEFNDQEAAEGPENTDESEPAGSFGSTSTERRRWSEVDQHVKELMRLQQLKRIDKNKGKRRAVAKQARRVSNVRSLSIFYGVTRDGIPVHQYKDEEFFPPSDFDSSHESPRQPGDESTSDKAVARGGSSRKTSPSHPRDATAPGRLKALMDAAMAGVLVKRAMARKRAKRDEEQELKREQGELGIEVTPPDGSPARRTGGYNDPSPLALTPKVRMHLHGRPLSERGSDGIGSPSLEAGIAVGSDGSSIPPSSRSPTPEVNTKARRATKAPTSRASKESALKEVDQNASGAAAPKPETLKVMTERERKLHAVIEFCKRNQSSSPLTFDTTGLDVKSALDGKVKTRPRRKRGGRGRDRDGAGSASGSSTDASEDDEAGSSSPVSAQSLSLEDRSASPVRGMVPTTPTGRSGKPFTSRRHHTDGRGGRYVNPKRRRRGGSHAGPTSATTTALSDFKATPPKVVSHAADQHPRRLSNKHGADELDKQPGTHKRKMKKRRSRSTSRTSKSVARKRSSLLTAPGDDGDDTERSSATESSYRWWSDSDDDGTVESASKGQAHPGREQKSEWRAGKAEKRRPQKARSHRTSATSSNAGDPERISGVPKLPRIRVRTPEVDVPVELRDDFEEWKKKSAVVLGWLDDTHQEGKHDDSHGSLRGLDKELVREVLMKKGLHEVVVKRHLDDTRQPLPHIPRPPRRHTTANGFYNKAMSSHSAVPDSLPFLPSPSLALQLRSRSSSTITGKHKKSVTRAGAWDGSYVRYGSHNRHDVQPTANDEAMYRKFMGCGGGCFGPADA